jgi:hypothetical protein
VRSNGGAGLEARARSQAIRKVDSGFARRGDIALALPSRSHHDGVTSRDFEMPRITAFP